MDTNHGAPGLEGKPVFDHKKCVENDLTEQQLEVLKRVGPRIDLLLNTKLAVKEFPEDDLEENGRDILRALVEALDEVSDMANDLNQYVKIITSGSVFLNKVLNDFSDSEMAAKAEGELEGFFDEQLESRFFDLDSYVKNLGSRGNLDQIKKFFSQFEGDEERVAVKEDELETKYRDLKIIYLSLRNRILSLKEIILQIENKISNHLKLEITMPKHGGTQLVYNANNVWDNLVKH